MRDLTGVAVERAQQRFLLGGAVIDHLRANLVAPCLAVQEVKIISGHARERATKGNRSRQSSDCSDIDIHRPPDQMRPSSIRTTMMIKMAPSRPTPRLPKP